MATPNARLAAVLAAIAVATASMTVCADQLDEFNAELARINLPLAGSADLNAIFMGKSYLTFSVKNPDGTATDYTLTDKKSVNRVFKAMKANSGFDSVYSSANGNSLLRTAVFSDTGLCSGPAGQYSVSNWTDGLNCLGLSQAHESAAILAASQETITTSALQFNRPTTQFANAMRFMRTMRQARPNSLSGGSSGADQYQLYGDIGLYFSAGGSFGNIDSLPGYTGFRLNRSTVSAGLDYRLSDTINAGILFSYVNSAASLYNNGGNNDDNIFRVAPYVSITPFDNAFIDVSAGYGYYQTAVNRNCDTCVSMLHGNYNSNEGFGSLNMGYAYSLSGITATGYGQVAMIGIATGSYRETGLDAAVHGASINSNGAISVTTTLGAELSYAWNTPYGVVVPRIFGEWLHEYKNNHRAIAGQFQNGAIPFAIQTASPERNWANLGAGAQMVLPNSLSVFVSYHSLIMTGAENTTFEGGVRWEF
ncbi:MAG: autotransporter outer membrane beta-barrel domain-containing protein [Candidatus Methylumidiphilus sp.]